MTIALLGVSGYVSAGAQELTPVVDGSIRDQNPKDGDPDDVLDNSIVQAVNFDPTGPGAGFEDRGVFEFDLSSVPADFGFAKLVLSEWASKDSPFVVDVAVYDGDGVLSLDDFFGIYSFSFVFVGGPPDYDALVILDVTPEVSAFKSLGVQFLGFNLRKAEDDCSLNCPFVAFRSNEFPPAPTLQVDDCLAPNQLVLSDETVLSEEVFEACRTITAGPSFAVVGPDGDATLRAGESVVLRDGFSVGVDARLTVVIEFPP